MSLYLRSCRKFVKLHLRSFGTSVFRQAIGTPIGTNSAPLLADLFVHTFEYDFMVKTMRKDITKAIQFSDTFRYIDDLFSINNVDFGNYISAIYPSELNLRTLPHHPLKCVISTQISRLATNHLSLSASTIRETTLHSRLSTFRIWTATFRPIKLTVFIYLNWWDMLEFARQEVSS